MTDSPRVPKRRKLQLRRLPTQNSLAKVIGKRMSTGEFQALAEMAGGRSLTNEEIVEFLRDARADD